MQHFFNILAVCTIFIYTAKLQSTPVIAPLKIDVEQPSGHKFTIEAKGVAGQHWYETRNGYTVVKDNHIWYYATKNLNGDLIKTTTAVGTVSIKDLAVPKHLKPIARKYNWYDVDKINTLSPTKTKASQSVQIDFNPEQTSAIRPRKSKSSSSLKTTAVTTQNLIVVEVGFDPFGDGIASGTDNNFAILNSGNVTTEGTIANAFFGSGKSVKDFYSKNFNGQFTIVPGEETQGTVNDGIISIILKQDHPGFGSNFNQADDLVETIYDTINNTITNEDDIDYIDYANYDINLDGIITPDELSIILVIAGYENAYAGNIAEIPNVWAHKGSITSRIYDGKAINQYTLAGEMHAYSEGNAHRFTIGIIAHELGHLMFGLPDLYDTDDSSNGVGDWGLMGTGSWNSLAGASYIGIDPAYMLAWSKTTTGMETSTTLSSSGSYSLSGVGSAGGSSRIWLDKYKTREYLLLENRQAIDYDAALPAEGLIISHINPVKFNNDNEINKLVDIEEADGEDDLDLIANSGDGGDPFPGLTNNTSFNATSDPDSLMYDTTDTGIAITSITTDVDDVNFNFTASTLGLADNISYISGNNTVYGIGFPESESKIAWTAVRFTNDTSLDLLDGLEFYARDSGTIEIFLYQSMVSKEPATELYHESTPVNVSRGWNRVLFQTAQTFTPDSDIILVLKVTTDSIFYPISFEFGNNQGRSYFRKLDSGAFNDMSGEANQRLLLSAEPVTDGDDDGMLDSWELDNGLNPDDASDADSDLDNDGLSNLEEFTATTDPNDDDSDDDGMIDGYEVDNGLDPILNDASEDADNDNLTNIEEYNAGTLINNPDSDNDELNDYDEIYIHNTDPLDSDTDDDGMKDGYEITEGLNPLDGNDCPGWFCGGGGVLKLILMQPPITGTWRVTDDPDYLLLVSFATNGTYFLAEIDPSSKEEQQGMEWGTYSRNKSTGRVTTTQVFDGNSDFGLNDFVAGNSAPFLKMKASGNTMTAKIDEDSNGSTDDTLSFIRQIESGFPGTWIKTDTSDDLLMIILMDDGTYIHGEVELSNADEVSGMEYGTYSRNSSTGLMTVTQTFNENGDTGLDDFAGSDAPHLYFNASGDTLTATIDNDGDGVIDETEIFVRQ